VIQAMAISELQQKERRDGTQDMVQKLLDERQEMLAMFCRVAGLEPFTHKAPNVDLLQEFCALLVDYSAFCHFEIYERIVDGRERRGQVVEVAREVYPRIAEASEAAVEFNDKYDASDHTLDLDQLENDLGRLGEELAIRIEMEDRIIEALTAR
jgi:regulator of sigma D